MNEIGFSFMQTFSTVKPVYENADKIHFATFIYVFFITLNYL